MSRAPRPLALTQAHVAFIHRVVPEDGTIPGTRPWTDAEYADLTRSVLAQDPEPGAPLRLFVYGSLIWKPEVPHVAEEEALLPGWHRSFCLHMPRYRGTPEAPGLMMAIDRGGSCRGLIFTLPPGDKPAQVEKLLRRELPMTPPGNLPRWLTSRTARGPVRALGFVANRASPRYTGRLSEDRVADVLAMACGFGGTGAEYLLQTVSHLEARGIHDSLLWRLQAKVAMRIAGAMGLAGV